MQKEPAILGNLRKMNSAKDNQRSINLIILSFLLYREKEIHPIPYYITMHGHRQPQSLHDEKAVVIAIFTDGKSYTTVINIKLSGRYFTFFILNF